MKSKLALVLALLVLLAGCNAFGGATTTPAATPGATVSETTTSTPAATPGTAASDTTMPETTASTAPSSTDSSPQSDLPPGMSDGTVTNASALLAAHEQSLASRSVTVRVEQLELLENGTAARNRTERFEIASNHISRYGVVVVSRYGEPVAGEEWANETVRLQLFPTGNQSQVQRSTPQKIQTTELLEPPLPLVAGNFSAESVSVTPTEDGSDTVRVVARNVVPADSSHSNATLTMVVGSEGRIHEYQYVANGTCEGQACRIVRTAEFSSVGETEIRKPTWVGNVSQNESAKQFAQSEGTD